MAVHSRKRKHRRKAAGQDNDPVGPLRERNDAHWSGYPLTVAKDRYSGAYSGGEWLAFPLDPAEVPEEPWHDDVSAAGYWHASEVRGDPGERKVLTEDNERHPRFVGRGRTPEDAMRDLEHRLRA